MKKRWQSERDKNRGWPAIKKGLIDQFSWAHPLMRRWDIVADWFTTRPGRITLATIALTAAWLILRA